VTLQSGISGLVVILIAKEAVGNSVGILNAIKVNKNNNNNIIRIIKTWSYEANERNICSKRSRFCLSVCVFYFQTFDLDLVSE